ncbi:MAG TPA: hypothetical protein VHX62_10655 [Solirubrobacteraceae bacterium]|nr:hypothetical protein [Solirubrobacteraceae bacterium]
MGNATSRERAAVAVGTGGTIEAALSTALGEAGIEGVLRGSFPSYRDRLRVVIKPVLAPAAVPSPGSRTYASPALVEGLAAWLRALDFADVTIAVSGPYGESAARRVGYRSRVHDLTHDTDTFYYGGRIGRHLVSRTWRDADLRVLVGRALPDRQLMYAGAIAAALGCVPDSDSLARRYVSGTSIAACANDLIEAQPVTFGVVDGFNDDWAVADAAPTLAVLASADLLALDWVLGEVAGLDGPQLGFLVAEALQRRGIIDIDREGDLTEWGDWRSPSSARVAVTDTAAGRWWGRLAGWQEVPWTAR